MRTGAINRAYAALRQTVLEQLRTECRRISRLRKNKGLEVMFANSPGWGYAFFVAGEKVRGGKIMCATLDALLENYGEPSLPRRQIRVRDNEILSDTDDW